MKAGQLTPAHIGHRITWQDKQGHHHMTLGHIHIETSNSGPTIVLIRAQGANPWDAWTLDGRRKVSVS